MSLCVRTDWLWVYVWTQVYFQMEVNKLCFSIQVIQELSHLEVKKWYTSSKSILQQGNSTVSESPEESELSLNTTEKPGKTIKLMSHVSRNLSIKKKPDSDFLDVMLNCVLPWQSNRFNNNVAVHKKVILQHLYYQSDVAVACVCVGVSVCVSMCFCVGADMREQIHQFVYANQPVLFILDWLVASCWL